MKKIKLAPPLQFFLAALGIEIARSVLTTLSYLLDNAGSVLAYPIFKISETVGLFLFFAAIGVAFAAASHSVKRATLLLFLETGAFFLGGFVKLALVARLLGQGIDAESLTSLVADALASSILPLFLFFLLGYAVFLRADRTSTPKGYHDFSSAVTKAVLLAACALFAYRLFGKIMEVLDYLTWYLLPNTAETVSIIVDLILIPLTSVCGYYVMLLARRLYRRAERRAEADTTEEK